MSQIIADHIYIANNVCMVYGWTNKLDATKANFQLFGIDSNKFDWVKLSRADVKQFLKSKDSSDLFGFALLFELNEGQKVEEVGVEFENLKLPLAGYFFQKPHYKALKQLGDINAGRLRQSELFNRLFADVKHNLPAFEVVIENAFNFNYQYALVGWANDEFEPFTAVYACDINGQRLTENLWKNVFRKSRFDVAKHLRANSRYPYGFITIANVNRAVKIHALEIHTKQDKYSIPIQYKLSQISDFNQASEELFKYFTPAFDEPYSYFDKGIGEWLLKTFRHKQKKVEPQVHNIGLQNEQPKISLVIPLYGRWDFMEHQMAQFSSDEFILRQEIIYVVDDPAIAHAVVNYAEQIFPIYKVPCKIVTYSQNLGYARANNIGVAVARGLYVLLLNSDILPLDDSWLEMMLHALLDDEKAGIIAPSLLYEDGSLQHYGMRFEKQPLSPYLWFNIHPFKGQPSWLLKESDELIAQESVTGACMLMPKSLFEKVGGFDENYPIGDFEDSDLCMKVKQEGLETYLAPFIRLYHLERKSQGLNFNPDWRQKVTLFNGWQHSRKWNEAINVLKSRN